MGAIYDATIDITYNMSKFEAQTKHIEATVTKLGNSLEKKLKLDVTADTSRLNSQLATSSMFGADAGRKLASSFRAATTAGLAGFSLTALIGGTALKAAGELEQTQTAFQNLFGTIEAGNKVFEDAKKFAATTPFEFPEVSQSIVKFRSMGLSADEAFASISTIGDALSVSGNLSGEALNRTVFALQQIQSKGKLSAEEMNQLAESMPNLNRGKVFENIAKQMGITTEQAIKLQEQGLVPSQIGIDAIYKTMREIPGAQGAMIKQSTTLLGLWSTMQDTVRFSLVGGVEDALPPLRDALSKTIGTMDQALAPISQGLKDVFAQLPKVLENAIPFVATFLGDVMRITASFMPAVGAAFGALTPVLRPLSDFLVIFGTNFSQMMETIAPVVSALGVALANSLSTLTPFINLGMSGMTAFAGILGKNVELIERIGRAFIAFKATKLLINFSAQPFILAGKALTVMSDKLATVSIRMMTLKDSASKTFAAFRQLRSEGDGIAASLRKIALPNLSGAFKFDTSNTAAFAADLTSKLGNAAKGFGSMLQAAAGPIAAIMGLFMSSEAGTRAMGEVMQSLAPIMETIAQVIEGLLPIANILIDAFTSVLTPVLNATIMVINGLIRAYNAIPVLDDIPTIKHISTDMDKAAGSTKNANLAAKEYTETIKGLNDKAKEIAPSIDELFTFDTAKGITNITSLTEAIKSQTMDVIQQQKYLQDLINAGFDPTQINTLLESVGDDAGNILRVMAEGLQSPDGVAQVEAAFAALAQKGQAAFQNVSFMSDEFQGPLTLEQQKQKKAAPSADPQISTFQASLDAMRTKTAEITAQIDTQFTAVTSNVLANVGTLQVAIQNAGLALIPTLIGLGTNIAASFTTGINQGMSTYFVGTFFTDIAGLLMSGINEASIFVLPVATQFGADIGTFIINGLKQTMPKITQYLFSSLNSAFLFAGVITRLSAYRLGISLGEALASGIRSTAGAIRSALSAAISPMNRMIASWNASIGALPGVPDLNMITFHSGGVVGKDGKMTGGRLKSDEVIAKLQKNELILNNNVTKKLTDKEMALLNNGNMAMFTESIIGRGLAKPSVKGDDIYRALGAKIGDGYPTATVAPGTIAPMITKVDVGSFIPTLLMASLTNKIAGGFAAETRNALLSYSKGIVEKQPEFAPGLDKLGSGIQAIIALAKTSGIPFGVSSTFRPGSITSTGNLSYHARGRAVDFVSPNMMALSNFFLRYAPKLLEMFYSPNSKYVKNGQVLPIGMLDRRVYKGHFDHVHVAMHTGGMVEKYGQIRNDETLRKLQYGEYVVQKSAVQKVGRKTLDSINQGNVPSTTINEGAINVYGVNAEQAAAYIMSMRERQRRKTVVG